MSDFINLTCNKCGSPIEREKSKETFFCLHCGSKYLLRNTSTGFQVEQIIEAIITGPPNLEKTSSELAIRRLKSEIETLYGQRQSCVAQLAIINTKSAAGIIVPILLLVAPLTGGFCLAILFAALIYDSITNYPIPWILGVVSFIGLNVFLIIRRTKPKRELRKLIAEIDRQILIRQQEIERNLKLIYQNSDTPTII